jgi:hypothetical protein
MRLAKVQLARAIWLFDTAEMNPHGSSIAEPLFTGLKRRYGFRKYPSVADIGGNSIRFEEGSFVLDEKSYDVSLQIYSDGISADTRHSTYTSDQFLLDVAKWAVNDIGLSFTPDFAKKRAYRSELVIYAPRGLCGLSEKLDHLSSQFPFITSGNTPEVTGFSIGMKGASPLFTFERKYGDPLEDLRFTSYAQMETDAHLAVLELMSTILFGESILSSSEETSESSAVS